MQVRVRVGAALEVTPAQLYRPLVDGAKIAARQISAELDKANSKGGRGSGGTSPIAKQAAEDRKALSQAAGDLARNAAIRKRYLQEQAREEARALAERKRVLKEEAAAREQAVRAGDKAAKDEIRRVREVAREQERAAKAEERRIRAQNASTNREARLKQTFQKEQKRAQDKENSRTELHVRRTGWSAMRNLSAVARTGSAVARDVANGAGIQFDIGSSVQRSIALNKTATDIANSDAIGRGTNATPEDVAAIKASIIKAGDSAKLDYGSVGAGLQEFIAKTGDLKTGKELLADLGDTAQATGSDFAELAKMAGEVAKNMPEGADKAEKTLAVVRMLAKQGAQGSVEVSDFAQYGGRIAASAQLYEGDLDKNVGRVGAMAQIASKGRAATAAEATNTAQNFARDITKKAALKRFEALGVDVFSDKSQTKLRDPAEIAKDFLKKSKGSLASLAKYFQADTSKRFMEQASAIYTSAEKEKKGTGLQAVDDIFNKFSATLTKADAASAANLSKNTDAARAQDFQNRLDKVGQRLTEGLLPSLEKLEPTILKAADGFASLVGYLAEHPGEAITAAIVGSIAKAGLATVVRGSIEAALRAAIAGIAPAALPGALPGVAGAAAAVGGTGAAVGGAGGTLGLSALAGPMGLAVAGGLAGMAVGGYQDWEKARKEREARGRTATSILDDPRQRINAALRDNGISVAPDAGVFDKDLRRFASTASDADAIEDARRKMQAETRKAENGGSFGISPALSDRLLASTGGARSMPGAPETNMSSEPNSTPAAWGNVMMADFKSVMREAPPEMKSMLEVLQRIAANTAANQGPPQPTGGRVEADGSFRMVR
jgi:hypothetical protein